MRDELGKMLRALLSAAQKPIPERFLRLLPPDDDPPPASPHRMPRPTPAMSLISLVGAGRFELPTPCSRIMWSA